MDPANNLVITIDSLYGRYNKDSKDTGADIEFEYRTGEEIITKKIDNSYNGTVGSIKEVKLEGENIDNVRIRTITKGSNANFTLNKIQFIAQNKLQEALACVVAHIGRRNAEQITKEIEKVLQVANINDKQIKANMNKLSELTKIDEDTLKAIFENQTTLKELITNIDSLKDLLFQSTEDMQSAFNINCSELCDVYDYAAKIKEPPKTPTELEDKNNNKDDGL